MGNPRVLCIGDIHAPWASEACILQIYEAISKNEYDIIIQMGDLYDMYSYSKFARSHDVCTPKEEIEQGYEWSQNFWKNINKLSQNSCKIQLKGNHDDRLMKRAFERWPEAAHFLSRAEKSLYEFAGVQTVEDSRDGLELHGVIYTHGYLTKLGDHAKYFLKPVVHGHSHRGGSVFYRLGGKMIWELDVGFCADQSQIPLQYGPVKNTLWTEGYGEVDAHGPRFIPIYTERKPKILLPPGQK